MERRRPAAEVAAALTMRQLQYFVAVAEDEHFTRASERLLIAQPALSRQVHELEEALQVELFVRNAHGVRLTEAGRELLARAHDLFAMLSRTVDAVRAAADGSRGRLRLGFYGPSVYNNLVPRASIERFRLEFPDVEIVVYEMFSEQVASSLRAGTIDVGISRDIPLNPDLDIRRLIRERLVVLLQASDPIADATAVAFRDLDHRGLITFPAVLIAGVVQRIRDLARENGASLHVAQEVTQLHTVAYLVSQGRGIAILPSSSAYHVLDGFEGIVTRDLSDPGSTIDLFVITRSGEESPMVHHFLEILETERERLSSS
jgi:LysR family transcriptional regulator, benzoate and cis,cis-muconate-responsive activator of ben and cat genes